MTEENSEFFLSERERKELPQQKSRSDQESKGESASDEKQSVLLNREEKEQLAKKELQDKPIGPRKRVG